MNKKEKTKRERKKQDGRVHVEEPAEQRKRKTNRKEKQKIEEKESTTREEVNNNTKFRIKKLTEEEMHMRVNNAKDL